MGYMRHHAIIVTTFDSQHAEDARQAALGIFVDQMVSPIQMSPVNGYFTFLVGPDGSKEGWEASNEGDDNRDAFLHWLNAQRYEDGSTPLDWAEVQYGDDDGRDRMCRRSSEPEWVEPVGGVL